MKVESSGKGFLSDGRPRILFEGHVFWRELKKRGIDPTQFVNEFTQNVLYKKWTKVHYVGGAKEYARLEKAAGMSDISGVHDAAYASASWGSFQIMGYHFEALGYASIDTFVANLYEHEREHLKAFAAFIKVNGLLSSLKNKDWAKFARGYNGSSFAKYKYDEKLRKGI